LHEGLVRAFTYKKERHNFDIKNHVLASTFLVKLERITFARERKEQNQEAKMKTNVFFFHKKEKWREAARR
jgi:hypothetical protein